MSNYSEFWDIKLLENAKKSTYSNWLDEHKHLLDKKSLPILDLGCGNGDDTNYLINKGFTVVSTDFSKSAIEKVSQINENTFLFDISKKEEWDKLKSKSFSVVIANLSLHYFDSQTTMMIMKEIKRVLAPNGILIARVNTNLDKGFGAGDGEELEENFYKNPERGIDKRFFTIEDAMKYFSLVGQPDIRLKTITYIGKEKQIFEIIVGKTLQLEQSTSSSSR